MLADSQHLLNLGSVNKNLRISGGYSQGLKFVTKV